MLADLKIRNISKITIALIGFVLYASATIVFLNLQTDSESVAVESPIITIASSSTRELLDETNNFIKTGNIDSCININDPFYKNVCTNNIALKKAVINYDVSQCSHIDNQLVSRSECEKSVLFRKSIQDENINLCFEATDSQVSVECSERYLSVMSIKKLDKTFCLKEKSIKKIDGCLSSLYSVLLSQDQHSQIVCSDFNDTDSVSDCEKVLTASKSKTINKVYEACSLLETDIFSTFCTNFSIAQTLSYPHTISTDISYGTYE